jgi:hypothetical protein
MGKDSVESAFLCQACKFAAEETVRSNGTVTEPVSLRRLESRRDRKLLGEQRHAQVKGRLTAIVFAVSPDTVEPALSHVQQHG